MSDSFQFKCPFCDQELKVLTESQGQIGKCPECSKEITIPVPEQTKKSCPFCGEIIKYTAKKCKHCDEWLEKNDNIQAETSQAPSLNITKKTKEIFTKHKLVVYLIFGVLAVLALSFYINSSKSTTENYFELGLKCYSIKDYKEAVKWYRKAAERGHISAQNMLGAYYLSGIGGAAKNYKEAVKWYRKAAEQGDADAQYKLAECYVSGNGVGRDGKDAVKWYRKEAVKWYRKAAEHGQVDAQFFLGVLYLSGISDILGKDRKEAVKWLRKAAEQGEARAQCFLGAYYLDGIGVAKDYKEAVKWYRKAAEQGNKRAIGMLKNNPKDDPYVISCRSNLKQILLSMKQYAMDYGYKFPSGNGMSGFNELIKKDYLTYLGVYRCHSSNPKTSGTSYIYLGGFMEGDSDRFGHANTPLVFDMPKNHNKIMNIYTPKNPYKIINVGFLDGHVESIKYSGEITTVRDVIDLLNKRESYSIMHLKILYEKADQVDRELSKVK